MSLVKALGLTPEYAERITRRFARWHTQPVNGCWLWQGGLFAGKGYGQFIISTRPKAKTFRAHRISYLIHCGEIPEGMQVNHTCDVRHCVRPDHLWIGSQKENIEDCWKKGRKENPPGEDAHNHKLTEAQVLEIKRASVTTKRECAALAARFGISHNHVYRIRSGGNWGHLRGQ